MIEEFTQNLVKPEPRKALDKSIIVYDIEPLIELTEEEKKAYYSKGYWTWTEAIYILQGLKPVFQISTEQVRSHFLPECVELFASGLQSGDIGKRIERAGEIIYLDSIENWQAFWLKNHTTTAPPAKQSTIVDIDEKPLSERSEAGYLLTISAMLKVFAGSGINQTYMVEEILKKYPNIHGLSKRSLDDKFSKSNNVFNEKLKDSKQCTQKN